MEQLIGIRDAAARLGTCTSTLRQWDKENKLVAVKTAGGHRRYRLSDVDKFIGSEEVEVKEVGAISLFDEIEITTWLKSEPIPAEWEKIFLTEIQKTKKLFRLEVVIGRYLPTFGTELVVRAKLVDAQNVAAWLQSLVETTNWKYTVEYTKARVGK